MQPHQQRVLDEKSALDEKVTKLQAFLDGQVFQTLDSMDQRDLHEQFAHMCDYSATLARRIARFT